MTHQEMESWYSYASTAEKEVGAALTQAEKKLLITLEQKIAPLVASGSLPGLPATSSTPSTPVATSQTQAYIAPVRFEGLTLASGMGSEAVMGALLASEIQAVVDKSPAVSPMTLTTLETQLEKEQQKELMACTEHLCIEKIIDNFGLSDTIIGVVTEVGGTWHVSLTWMRDDVVLGHVTSSTEGDETSLMETVRALAAKLLDLAVAPDKTPPE